MGSSDGKVLGLAEVRVSGRPRDQWNLVVVPDGFREEELPLFAQWASVFADHFLATTPFGDDEVKQRINIYRLDVASAESGADKPAGDDVRDPYLHPASVSGKSVRTYFDSTFKYQGGPTRLLFGDQTLVLKTVLKALRQFKQVVVMVNDQEFGGGGTKDLAWVSVAVGGDETWMDVAIHEIGHSFGLGDEYGEARVGGGTPLAEQPNVSRHKHPKCTRWKNHVKDEQIVSIPTRGNPNRGVGDIADPGPDPMPYTHEWPIGTFEGAGRRHFDAYRPTWTCRMRETWKPFCPVCREVIRRGIVDAR